MYAALSIGASSHKHLASNIFLRLYYTNSNVLFGVCAGDQLFFMCLYLLGSPKELIIGLEWMEGYVRFIMWLAAPICFYKQILNVVQLVGASQSLVRVDESAREKGKDKVK